MASLHRAALVSALCVLLAAAAAGGVFFWSADKAQRATVERIMGEARRTAALAARTAALVRDVPRAADDMLSDHAVAEAALLGLAVDGQLALKATPRVASERARAALDGTVLSNPLVRTGRTLTTPEPTDPDLRTQRLPDGSTVVVEPARRTAPGGPVVKRVTATNADRSRAVGVDIDAARIAALSRRIGIEHVVDDLLAAQAADAVWVLTPDRREMAHGAVLSGGARASISAAEQGLVEAVLTARLPLAAKDRGTVSSAAVIGSSSEPVGVVLLRMPGTLPSPSLLVPAALAAVAGLVLTVLTALVMRHATRAVDEPMERLAECAAALKDDRYNPFTLNELCDRHDAAGRMARAFRAMAVKLTERAEHLETQLQVKSDAGKS